MSINYIYTANQDIRDYMADHGVSQKVLANQMGVTVYKLNGMLKTELTEAEKDELLRHIDAIVGQTHETPEEAEDDVTVTTKFQIGDRVKIPSKAETIGVVTDIWSSLAQSRTMYEVAYESNGNKGLYAENQLEPAPLPIEYSFTATIEENVAVVCMIAKQGEKTWVYARGHAHILHDGAVGMAQAVSFAGKRMFETLDKAQPNQIYFKDKGVK